AGRGEHPRERCSGGRLVDHLHEDARRAAIGGGGPRLADRDVVARVLRVLHALEVHEKPVRIDDRDGDVPAVLGALGEDAGSNFLRRGSVDRRAILGTAILRQRKTGGREKRQSQRESLYHGYFLLWKMMGTRLYRCRGVGMPAA